LLGSRASADLVRSGAESAELEALFEIAGSSRVAGIMSAHGYEASEGLLIRRIISRHDANRVYINGRIATIQLLNALTENLASISGQHAHQLLLKEEQHLFILDQFSGLMPLREAVSACYNRMIPQLEELKKLKTIKERQAEQIELLEFQKNEITSANPAPDEDRNLEQERMRLKNAEELYQTVYNSIESLYGAPGSAMENMVAVIKDMEKIGRIDRQLNSKAKRLQDTAYQIEDLIEELRGYLNNIQMDEKQLDAVEERLDCLNKLKRKYGGSLDAVFEKRAAIEQELCGIEHIGEKIKDAESRVEQLFTELKGLAVDLSRKRKKAAGRFAKSVTDQLATLKMSKTGFDVEVQAAPADKNTEPYLTVENRAISEIGIDRATFLIAPNVGEDLKPLASIASGGELSRVVLALKALLAKTESVETVVFDEVDAGIGGGVAEVVGKKLADLAKHHQVICITHLPQIAKFGDQHFRISKKVSAGRTRTTIHLLNTEDRYQEIARMLGGEKITQTTLAHAREMLDRQPGRNSSRLQRRREN
jgi:DNA repair protein RecN (Recombination protein N)